FMRGATASWMRAPTAELPVNEIMSTSGASTSASPISGPWPATKLRTPGGRTAATIRQSAATPSGSAGAGFTTSVLPQARAGPIFPAQLVIGKLKGVMPAATPTGPRRGAHLLDGALRRVAGELLGRRVDHRVRPPRGAHPLAADQDLVDDGDAHAAFALSAASRWRVVRCIGSWSNRGSTCLPKVSIDSSTYFWSRVRVKGA